MSGAGVEITGAETALRALSEAHEKLANPFEMYDKIGSSLVTSTKKRFDEGVTPDNNPWPESIRALVEGGQTLVDSRNLRDSITHIASENSAEVGTNVIYAAVHQFGATIIPKSADALRFSIPGIGFITSQSVTIPARPFIGLSDDDEDEVEAIAYDYISQAFGGSANAN